MTPTPTAPIRYEIGGRTVTMPVVVRDAAAGTALFDVDAAAAQALVPGGVFQVVESSPGRTQLNLATIDYRDNDLGDYNEVGITLFVAPRAPEGAGGDRGAAGGAEGAGAAVGTFITHLPVNQQFTCDAGRLIWGFPKSVEEITVDQAGASTTTTLRMDGEPVLRITLPRGGSDEMPPLEMVTYSLIDGVPHATSFSQGGRGSQVVPGGDGVELELGTHPLADTLRSLGLPSEPVLTTWTEHMQGRFEAPRPLAG
jgi:hypothetical protein